MQNVNVSVVITGNLTRDPELRHTGGGTEVCNLRVAVNGRRKNGTRASSRQAQLLQRHRLGRPGRGLRQAPQEGSPGRGRRSPRLEGAGRGRRPPRVRPDRRQHGPVPRRQAEGRGGRGRDSARGPRGIRAVTTGSPRPTAPRTSDTSKHDTPVLGTLWSWAAARFDAGSLEAFAIAVEAEVVDPVKLADQLRAMAARIREAA